MEFGMAGKPELEAAFDAAIADVAKCTAAGMETSSGGSAATQLEKLGAELLTERTRATNNGSVDRAWLQATLRWLVAWAPDEDLTLIAALGRIARAGPHD